MPFVEPPPRPAPARIAHENRLDCPCPPCAAYRAQLASPRMSWIGPLIGLALVTAASAGVVALVLLAAGVIRWHP